MFALGEHLRIALPFKLGYSGFLNSTILTLKKMKFNIQNKCYEFFKSQNCSLQLFKVEM